MKTIAALLTIAAFALCTSPSQAQQASAQSQQAAIPTSYVYRVSDEKTPVMSFAEVKSITENSVRQAVSNQLMAISTQDVNSRLAGTFDDMVKGHTVGFSSPVSGLAARSINEQYSMNVSVHYEARPIGGILTIKVELVPVFTGIGSASRPVAYREMSQAIDNLEEDALGDVVSDLTHQLGADYAAK